jgi:hypothetical protein
MTAIKCKLPRDPNQRARPIVDIVAALSEGGVPETLRDQMTTGLLIRVGVARAFLDRVADIETHLADELRGHRDQPSARDLRRDSRA